MARILPRDPIFIFKLERFKKSPKLPYPLNNPSLYLFGYGRVALYEGLRVIGVKAKDNILVPNYICNVVISSVHRIGATAKLYGVNRDLTPDWDSVKKNLDKNTRGLLIVNYFGFPNDLTSAKRFCKENRICLIEDNAHGFLGSREESALGSSGDISIFSFRKTLPMPAAAGLLINNPELLKDTIEMTSLREYKGLLRFCVKSFISTLQYYSGIFPNSYIKDKIREIELGNSRDEEYNLDKYYVKFPEISSLILKHLNVSFFAEQRRKMYLQWLDFFKTSHDFEAEILFPRLLKGIVPYVFPVLVGKQKEFILAMWKRKIECFPWPYLPKGSNEEYFSKRLVCLPVFPYTELKNF